MQEIDKAIAQWLDQGWVSPALIAVACIGSFLVGLALLIGQRRYAASATRLEKAKGIVREAEVLEWTTKGGNQKSSINLAVDFQVEGRPFCCHRWDLYGAGGHFRKAAPPLRPGDTVLVWYDQKNPKISALVVGAPSYASGVIALALALFFLFLGAGLAA